MAQQLGSNYYNSPFKFNGKELDEETGFYYYGARYYDPKISIWLSVDPLSENYRNISPYVYVANNPLIAIDPDGRGILNVIGNLFKRTSKAISKLFSGKCDCQKEQESIAQAWRRDDPTTRLLKNILGIGDFEANRNGVYTFYEKLNINFEQNSYKILDSNKAMLDKLVEKLKSKGVKNIILTGNSNASLSDNFDGTVELDGKTVPVEELKRKRAEAVKDYLVKNGVKESKIEINTGDKEVKTTDIQYTKKIKK